MNLLFTFTLMSSFIATENFDGYYSLECDGFHEPSGKVLIENGEAVIELATNQIYIKTQVLNQDDSFQLYYKSSDIGLGGFDIPFDKIDSTYPIAQINQIRSGIALNWFGLIDSDGKKIDLPFYTLPIDKGILKLQRCN
ncbi:hypothetical protein TW84_02010 [Vibrio neptunius]|uniref:hypothetical protein n=1 Tax=Vibrio neptunius TaxID=170651 RepID=UPI0005FA0451|nr:hypothetical protein [Vibrio neptunius]KJY93839.1 hypothetical protein TW84_02010 [Vibrio neptunius]